MGIIKNKANITDNYVDSIISKLINLARSSHDFVMPDSERVDYHVSA